MSGLPPSPSGRDAAGRDDTDRPTPQPGPAPRTSAITEVITERRRRRTAEPIDGLQLKRRLRRARRRLWRTRHRARKQLRYLRYSREGRRLRWALIGAGALVGLGVVWIVVTAWLARRDLQVVQARVGQVQVLVSEGRLADARTVAAQIPTIAHNAHRLTTGPAWWTAAALPYFGDPAEVMRATTEVSDDLAGTAIADLVDVSDKINPATLRAHGDTIRYSVLSEAAPALRRASTSIGEAMRQLRGLPTNTWLSPMNHTRAGIVTQLTTFQGYVDAAGRAADIVPTLFGSDGRTRRFFIGLQNDAEMRGTGGLPGAFAIASTHDGTLTFDRFESDGALLPPGKDHKIATVLDFGKSYDALYAASDPTQEYVDSNVSPQFPYAARIWAAMWEKLYHQHIDGAIALDPTTLAYFLDVVGPAVVPGKGVVTAQNVVSLTQRDAYTLFPNYFQRKDFLVAVLKAASLKLTSGSGNAISLVRAASLAASQRRLLVWSDDPAIEKVLEQSTWAGDIAADGRPLSAVILNNSAAGKLDYYLKRTIQYSRTGCGAERDVSVTITLTNNAPASGLPAYVTDRVDPPAGSRPGDSSTVLDYFATGGAQLQSVAVDGRLTAANATTSLGRAVFRLPLELPRGQTRTIELHLSEPAATGAPVMWIQPGVQPVSLNEQNQTCG